jgi:hypothetical protein
MKKKKYKPVCKVGDLIIWRNDKGLITEIRTHPEATSMFTGNTYYILEWQEQQEDGSYLIHKESSAAEQLDDAIFNKIYDHYPVKQ